MHQNRQHQAGDRVPISDLVRVVPMDRLMEDLDIPVTAHGGRLFANCWVHADRTASVIINTPERSRTGKWHYYCMACRDDVSGDNLDLVRTRLQLSPNDAWEWLNDYAQRGGHAIPGSPPPPPVVRERRRMRAADQVASVAAYLEIVTAVVPTARADGAEFLRSRGIATWLAQETHAYAISDRDAAHTIAQRAINSEHRDLFLEGGLLKSDPERGIRPVWPDEVCLLAATNRAGDPAYVIGRRFHPTEQWKTRYLNQMCENGAFRVPGNLLAINRAKERREPLRIVEGFIKALGSESLSGVLSAPAIALHNRVGFAARIDPGLLATMSILVPDLRDLPRVEIVPDNDLAGIPAKLADEADATRHAGIIAKETQKNADGEQMAGNLAAWLRTQGVPAVVNTLSGMRLGEFKDFDEVAKSLRSGGRRTADLDQDCSVIA